MILTEKGDLAGVRQGGPRLRHPPGLPRHGQERQRLRCRPGWAELYPLSMIVQHAQDMQTSLHLDRPDRSSSTGSPGKRRLSRGQTIEQTVRDEGMKRTASAAEAVVLGTECAVSARRGLPVERTPIWLMRQAGRYEYQAVRQT